MIEYYEAAFKPVRFMLWITGLRPFENSVKPLLSGCLMFQGLVFTLTTMSFLHETSFLGIVDIVLGEFINILGLIRLITFIYFQEELKKMFQDMEKMYPITDPGLHNVLKYLKFFQHFFITEGTGILLVVLTHGLLTGVQLLHLHKPEMIPEIVCAIFIVDGYIAFMHFLVTGTDLFFFTLTMLLIVQYKILNSNLRNCPSDHQEQQHFVMICVKHNHLLKGMIEGINVIFGPMLLVFMWDTVIFIGMLMYAIYIGNGNPLDFTKFFVIIFGIVLEVFFCYVVPTQLLTNEVNQMFDEVYCTNWYEWSVPVQKSIVMILTNKKTDAVITAAGKLVEMNFRACTSMFRTCFSVYTFLVHMTSFKAGNFQ